MARTSRRTKTKSGETGFRIQAQKAARLERAIQRKIDRLDARVASPKKKETECRLARGATRNRNCQVSIFPSRDVKATSSSGTMYEAPYYQGSDKLRDMIAIVTGGAEIQVSDAPWRCFLRVKAQMLRLHI